MQDERLKRGPGGKYLVDLGPPDYPGGKYLVDLGPPDYKWHGFNKNRDAYFQEKRREYFLKTGYWPPEFASSAELESILALGFWLAAWLSMFALGMTVFEPVHQADFLRSMFVVATLGVALAGLVESWCERSLGAAVVALVLGGAVGLRLLFLIGG